MDDPRQNDSPAPGTVEPRVEDEDSLVGTLLADRFLLQSLIGAGAVGEVYLAEHQVLGVRYAVKVLREDFADDEEVMERFRREAYAASRLHHPHIVQTHDFGRTEDDELYLVMEHVDGVPLSQLIADHAPAPLPLRRALCILVQLGGALEQAHEANIVHRDLKPDNLLVARSRDGGDVVKVLDFGLAKVLEDDENPITRMGQVFGSPRYMSPEQARGAEVDTRSDLYSYGVLAYELLCGRPPFDYASVPQLLMAHLEESPPLPSAHLPLEAEPLPEPLEDLVLRCLEKAPDARPQRIGEVVPVLQGLLEAQPAATRRAIPADVDQVIRETGVFAPLDEDAPPSWESPQWLPEGQAATLRTVDAPMVTPSARPGDPAYREWFWGQAVKLAKLLATQLLASDGWGESARQAGLGDLVEQAACAEDQSIEAQADMAVAEAELAELDADSDPIERDLRYAIVDLSVTLGREMDAATRDPTRLSDLKEQLRHLEENLSTHLRDKAARQAALEANLAERQTALAEQHQAQVRQETALMAALQRLRPDDPLPPLLLGQYEQLGHFLKHLRDS